MIVRIFGLIVIILHGHNTVFKTAKAAAEAGEANGKEHFKDIPDNKPKGPLSQDQQTEVKTTLSRGPMFSEVR